MILKNSSASELVNLIHYGFLSKWILKDNPYIPVKLNGYGLCFEG